MGQVMTLADILGSLDSFDAEDTIYAAEPWNKGAKAIVAHEPQTGGLPKEAEGLKYFLEIFVARDFLEDWKPSLNKEPTRDEVCARLIHYAIHDA